MLKWAAIFFVISLLAGALGFGGLASRSAVIAKILFGIFLALVIVFILMAWLAGELLW